jgi:hypothetical protein
VAPRHLTFSLSRERTFRVAGRLLSRIAAVAIRVETIAIEARGRRHVMRELWALILVCSAVFAAFATAMLVVLVHTGRHKDMLGTTALMVMGGWVLAYLALKLLMAIPKKKEDIW